MNKKISILVLMLLACMAGFAQSNKGAGADIHNEAKKVVTEQTKDFLTNMQKKLNNPKDKAKVEFGNLKKSSKQQQFLFADGKIDSLLKCKSHGLSDVFTNLCNKENAPTKFRFNELHASKNIHCKIFETGKHQGKADSSKWIVPVSFNTHTIAKNKVSDVEYSVVLEWEVSIKKGTAKGNKGEKTTSFTIVNPVLLSSTASPLKKESKKPKGPEASTVQKDSVVTSPILAEKAPTDTENTVVIAKEQQESQFTEAIDIVLEYAFQLSNYVADANEKTKKKIERLFVNNNVEIEVSNVQENGTEKIQKRFVKEYLSLLKGNSLKIELDSIIDHKNNESPIFMVSQAYRSDTYNDDTQKQVYLKYNAAKKTYLINKITVVPNSTRINRK